MDGASTTLEKSGDQFQKDAVSVSGFIGFVWMEGGIRVTNTRFQKYPNSCGGLNHCVYEDAGITLYIFRSFSCLYYD